jgi:transketolase
MGKSWWPSRLGTLSDCFPGMAPVAHVLFNKFMTFNPQNPDFLNRDRFVLS